jgi:ligand-binding sensor domain-containing protein
VETQNSLSFGWTSYNFSNSPLPGNNVTAVFVDSRNQTWVGTTDGLAVLSGDGGRNFSAADHSVLEHDVVAIAEDYAGCILVGTYSGAARFDGVGWSRIWPLPNDSSESEVRCITVDDNAAVWMGIGFSGAVRVGGDVAQYFNSSNSGIRGPIVRRIAKSPDGSLWFAGSDGLSRLLNGLWSEHGPKSVVTSILVQSPDTVAFGSYDGTLHRIVAGVHWDAVKMKPYESFPRQPAAITGIAKSADGSLWLDTFGSIRRFDPDSLTELLVVLPSNSNMPERDILGLTGATVNTLWIGTRNSGAYRWDLSAAGMPEPAIGVANR